MPLGRPRRTLVAICCSAGLLAGGVAVAPQGFADPDPTLAQVRAQVDALERQGEAASERFNAATDALGAVQVRLTKAQEGVAAQEQRLRDLTTEMGGFAAASYRTGGVDPSVQVFLSDDPAEFLAQASVADAYATQQADQLSVVAKQRQRVVEQKVTADSELDRLRDIEEKRAADKAAIEASLDDAQRLLDSLEAEERARLEAERRAELAQAERDAAAARASRDDVRAAAPAARSAAQAGSSAQAAAPAASAGPVSGRAGVAVDFAMAQIGDRYVHGAAGPDAWDCSGLTGGAWRAAGVALPRSSGAQAGAGRPVSRNELQPGDLVFYYSPIHHVALYIGNGRVVHASRPGRPVGVAPVFSMPFTKAIRVG